MPAATMTGNDVMTAPGRPGGGIRRARVGLALWCNLVERSTGLWIAYFIAWMLATVFPLVLVATAPGEGLENAMPYFWDLEYGVALIGTAIGAIAAAVRCFRYVFSRVEADFAGALPLRRSGLFAASALAGLLPLLGVEVLVCLVLVVLGRFMPVIGLAACGQWLAVTALFTLVSYATALLCVQLSGTVSAAVWLFLGASFFIVLVEQVVRFFAGYLIWGLDLGSGLALTWTSPLLGMWQYGVVGSLSDSLSVATGSLEPVSGVTVAAGAPVAVVDWGALGLYCAVGAVFALLAFLLNGVRPLERAGETVPYRWLGVVLSCAGGAIGALVLAGIAIGLLANAFGSPLATSGGVAVAVSAGVGGLLGTVFMAAYVHGESGKFRAPWKMGVTVGVVAAVLVLACAFDALGVESRVPAAGDVSEVKVSVLPNGDMQTTLGESGDVDDVTGLHRKLLNLRDDARRVDTSYEQTWTYALVYTLKDGSTLRRSYVLPEKGKEEKRVRTGFERALNSEEGVESRLATLRHANARGDLDISFDSVDDDSYDLSAKETTAFIEGPLASDARAHGALDVHLTTDGGGYGTAGMLSLESESGDWADISIPVSKKGTPAIYHWPARRSHLKG